MTERQEFFRFMEFLKIRKQGVATACTLRTAADRVCYGLFWLEFKLLMRQRVEMVPTRLIFWIGRLDLLYLFKGNLLNSTSGLYISCQLSKIEKMLISLTFPFRF